MKSDAEKVKRLVQSAKAKRLFEMTEKSIKNQQNLKRLKLKYFNSFIK